jgi:hypothetical protein
VTNGLGEVVDHRKCHLIPVWIMIIPIDIGTALGIYRTYLQFGIDLATLIDFEIYGIAVEMLGQASFRMSATGMSIPNLARPG